LPPSPMFGIRPLAAGRAKKEPAPLESGSSHCIVEKASKTPASISPLTTVVVTVARVMPARSHPVRLATQNSRRRAGMLSAWACAAGLLSFDFVMLRGVPSFLSERLIRLPLQRRDRKWCPLEGADPAGRGKSARHVERIALAPTSVTIKVTSWSIGVVSIGRQPCANMPAV
jgi:hypothetical protein